MDAQLISDLAIIAGAAVIFTAGFIVGREWQKVDNMEKGKK